jgi:hypothetical protein
LATNTNVYYRRVQVANLMWYTAPFGGHPTFPKTPTSLRPPSNGGSFFCL